MTTDDFRAAIGDMCDAEIVALMTAVDSGDSRLVMEYVKDAMRSYVWALSTEGREAVRAD